MFQGWPRCLLAVGASLCLTLAAGCANEGADDSSAPVTPPSAQNGPTVTNVTVAANSPAATNAAAANTPAPTNATATNAASTSAPAANAAASNLVSGAAGAVKKAQPPAKAGKNPVVVLETSLGTIKVQLDSEKAPISTKNFVEYVQSGHYDGTVFHRVISTFMIQGGGFTADKKEKDTRAPIKNEAGNGLKNKRGTIAMARTRDPNSATAQFYINVKDNDSLDRENAQDGFGYAVFGKVIAGMDVVDKIKDTPTEDQGGAFTNAPVTPVVIKSAKIGK